MVKKLVTPKFTLNELRDNISQQKCGARSQSRRFFQLDRHLKWTGIVASAKVPVIELSMFPKDTLAQSKLAIVLLL